MTGPCPFSCENKTTSGYCATTVCTKPEYQNLVQQNPVQQNLVPVVYCNNCKYSELRNIAYTEAGFAPYFCNHHFRGVYEKDFCSRGVRR